MLLLSRFFGERKRSFTAKMCCRIAFQQNDHDSSLRLFMDGKLKCNYCGGLPVFSGFRCCTTVNKTEEINNSSQLCRVLLLSHSQTQLGSAVFSARQIARQLGTSVYFYRVRVVNGTCSCVGIYAAFV